LGLSYSGGYSYGEELIMWWWGRGESKVVDDNNGIGVRLLSAFNA